MENSNQEDLSEEGLVHSGRRRFNLAMALLIFAGIIILFLAAIIISYAVVVPGQTKPLSMESSQIFSKEIGSGVISDNIEDTNRIEESTGTILSAPLSVNQALGLAPAAWGSVAKVSELGESADSPKIYSIDFANQVSAVFQEGVPIFVFNKVKERVDCTGKMNTNSLLPVDNCYVLEHGAYNLDTKQFVEFDQAFPYWADSSLEISPFDYVGEDGQLITAIFTPQGKYFAQGLVGYEGCSVNFINTATGHKAAAPQEADENSSLGFSCEPLLDFSADGETISVRSIYGDMASPETKFNVIRENKQWEILPKLLTKELESNGGEIDLRADFKVTAVNEQEVRFSVLKDTDYYQRGSYIFSLSSNKLSRE